VPGTADRLQLHGRAGNRNPHLHFVVSEGGVDKDGKWREVNFFDLPAPKRLRQAGTKKLRKKWQYHVITALKKAVRGTAYEAEWYDKLGAMFGQYPTGFDCDCMPEEGPVERLVVYLLKYVSSPPISIRRIEGYDGENVTYRYEDHRKGEVRETIPATEFIGRMIQHLPPKGFRTCPAGARGGRGRRRMVRYYGIYARPVRDLPAPKRLRQAGKIHALVADALKALVRRAKQVAEYFARKRGTTPEQYREKLDERFGKGELRCPACGATKMLLIRIWSKTAGLVYELTRDGVSTAPVADPGRGGSPLPIGPEQLAFAF
jgi:hypothetical protein